jgi:hypothetical protein
MQSIWTYSRIPDSYAGQTVLTEGNPELLSPKVTILSEGNPELFSPKVIPNHFVLGTIVTSISGL